MIETNTTIVSWNVSYFLTLYISTLKHEFHISSLFIYSISYLLFILTSPFKSYLSRDFFFFFIFFYSILISNPSNHCKTISKCPHQICKYYVLPIVSGKGGKVDYSHPVNKQRVKLAIQKKKWRMNKQLYLQLGSSTIFFFNSILLKLNRKN